jgi:hypothetical protein
MLEKHQRLCVWAGAAFVPLFVIGFASTGWLPPPSAALSAEQIKAIFDEDGTRIRIAMWFLTGVAPLLAFFGAALVHQCRRIVGDSPLVTVQTVAVACLVVEFIIPQMVWQTALYRDGASAEKIQTLNDQAWMLYLGVPGTVMAQMIVLAICILQDRHETPLVPRWVAYLNLWLAFGVVSGGLIVFAHTGPISWNGILSWWLVAGSFFVWMATMSWAMLGASRRAESMLPQSA